MARMSYLEGEMIFSLMRIIVAAFIGYLIWFSADFCGFHYWANDTTGKCTARYNRQLADFPAPWIFCMWCLVLLVACAIFLFNYPPLTKEADDAMAERRIENNQ